MLYNTLVFDLDGTLTDPLQGIVRCMNFALTSHDHPPRSEQEITRYVGPPLEVALQAFSGSNDEAHVRELVATYRERYGELGYRENRVYDGVVAMLQQLHGAGIPLGVCTSKLQKYAVKVLESFDLAQYFSFIDGPTGVGITKQQQLGRLLEEATIDPTALMIGDRAVDLTSAHANHLNSAGVLWGFGSATEIHDEQPAFVFESPAQVAAQLA